MKFNCKCPDCQKRFQHLFEQDEVTVNMLSFQMNNGFIYKHCVEHSVNSTREELTFGHHEEKGKMITITSYDKCTGKVVNIDFTFPDDPINYSNIEMERISVEYGC